MRSIFDASAIRRLMSGLAIAAFAIAADASSASAADAPALVQIDAGKVRGTVAHGVIAFKGIPYAQPPVGALRWRPPQPVEPWQDILAASELQFDCVQPANMLPAQSKGISEDCLYVNVWRPAGISDKPLPVMVWIYGGGLVRGGASLYPGDFLAAQGLVYVSFNYRLGRFGFFAHPALAKEFPDSPRGNYGYMDQLAALQWVKRNIAAFGGDPDNVTIAGESAGGGSVLTMLTSPMARGLFNRAILESPGIPSPRAEVLPMRPLAAAEKMAANYARSLGIGADDEVALMKLRAIPAATLNEGTEEYVSSAFGDQEIPGLSFSIVDGRLVVEPPETAIHGGRQAMVPVIIGANDADLATSPARTKDELFALFGPLAAQARALYDPKGEASLKTLIEAVIADRAMVEPSRNLAELMAQAGEPVYYYRFSYVPQVLHGKVPGATHGSEIPFAFDAVAAAWKDQATAADVAMAKMVSGYWAAFVKSGDPNGAGRPEWRRYDPRSPGVLNFTNMGVTFGADPRQQKLDLWKAVWGGR
jgi:para-nitrobenzyl esterase